MGGRYMGNERLFDERGDYGTFTNALCEDVNTSGE